MTGFLVFIVVTVLAWLVFGTSDGHHGKKLREERTRRWLTERHPERKNWTPKQWNEHAEKRQGR